MTEDQKQSLKQIIIVTSMYYGRPLADDVVRLYVEDLSQFDFELVKQAVAAYRQDSKNRFMFLPAQIREIINPIAKTDDLAMHTAMRIKQAITKFGWPGAKEAKEFIGDAGWRIVSRFGGWNYLCQNLGIEMPDGVFIAQCRDVLKSEMAFENMGYDVDKPAIEQRKTGLISAGESMKEMFQAVLREKLPAPEEPNLD